MNPSGLESKLTAALKYDPTPDQEQAIHLLSQFLTSRHGLFILRGYAGTGKTTLISALVRSLPGTGWKVVLLAPTGRAAKVLSGYSSMTAVTVHKKIYRKSVTADGGVFFSLQENLHVNTLFVVDESSMIGLTEGFRGKDSNSLLEDIFEYVFSGTNCRLLFAGDTAQLPPVNCELSPALDDRFLENLYGMTPISYELKDVVRQSLESGILYNATEIRESIHRKISGYPPIKLKFPDIHVLDGTNLEDALNDSYTRTGNEGTIVLCRSNKRTNQFNAQIRARIKWLEEEIATGDYLMVVKNNYFWLPEGSRAGFIANGDMIQVLKIRNYKDLHDLRFAEITFTLVDYPEEPAMEAKVILNVLSSEAASLSDVQQKKLYESVQQDYMHEGNKKMRNALVRKDPYLNALQVKFAYAVTCHKAQGGQWENVFIDQGYLTDEMMDVNYQRWLYTAFTRATKNIYLINFSDKFFH